MSNLIRVQFQVFPSFDAALNAGYPDAEFGDWQASPASTKLTEGWIALTYDEHPLTRSQQVGLFFHQNFQPSHQTAIMAMRFDSILTQMSHDASFDEDACYCMATSSPDAIITFADFYASRPRPMFRGSTHWSDSEVYHIARYGMK